MKVILLSDIKGVGKKDQIINANDGYARNYLIPKKLAVEANSGNLANLKAKQESNQYRKDMQKEEAIALANKMKDIVLTLKVKAGENGKIFGGITAKEISENLKNQYKIDVDKKRISYFETKTKYCPPFVYICFKEVWRGGNGCVGVVARRAHP